MAYERDTKKYAVTMAYEIASSSLIETLISAFKIRSHKVRSSPNIYQIVSFVRYQFSFIYIR